MSGPDKRGDCVAVIGGGFYGLRISLFLREELGVHHVQVFERGSAVMDRASFGNQARVHNGYHYPRSILTAYRSRVNFPLFRDEYRDAIVDSFDHYYAVARVSSKVNARQFELFCSRIGASLAPAPPAVSALFHPGRIEKCWRVSEPAFDSRILRSILLDRIASVGGIEIRLRDEVQQVARDGSGLTLRSNTGEHRADRVISATYSRINVLHRASALPSIDIQHEVSEMALVRLPEQFRSMGITVMDGPFFSIMPFPSRGLHTLSHVRFTPRYRWRDISGSAEIDPYDVISVAADDSGFAAMRADVARYVPALRSMDHVDSIREVKTVLAKSETDDSRPILYRPDHGLPAYTCVMGGKLDNIYDVLTELEATDARV